MQEQMEEEKTRWLLEFEKQKAEFQEEKKRLREQARELEDRILRQEYAESKLRRHNQVIIGDSETDQQLVWMIPILVVVFFLPFLPWSPLLWVFLADCCDIVD